MGEGLHPPTSQVQQGGHPPTSQVQQGGQLAPIGPRGGRGLVLVRILLLCLPDATGPRRKEHLKGMHGGEWQAGRQ